MEATAMFRHIHIKNVLPVTLIALCMLSTACAQTSIVRSNCDLPSSNRINAAIAEAQATLAQRDCAARFDDIFDRLIYIAQNDTDTNNRREFSDFLNWSRDQNLINTRQAKDLYTRYFSHKFVSLPRDYQTCTHCREIGTITRAMKAELVSKQTGLLKICGERDLYARAAAEYEDLQIILEATCKACQNGE